MFTMRIRRWLETVLMVLTCLLVEGAVVVGIAFGLGSLLY